MRLSEAMRLGALLSPQGFGPTGMVGEARCALGAALEATQAAPRGLRGLSTAAYSLVNRGWPWLFVRRVSCPVCADCPGWPPAIVIGHLNDQHRWTRAAIADWVETLETQAAVAPAPVAGVGTAGIPIGTEVTE
jgi:hypothetical protein